MGETRRVAILGTRFADFSVEESVLGPDVHLEAGDGATPDDVVAQATGSAVVLTGPGPRFDARVIARLSCRGIVRYGVGVESVDLDAAVNAGMWVAYVPDYGTDAVAVHTMTLVLAAVRRLTAADAAVKAGRWGIDELRPLRAPQSMTAGIVGFGRIGRRVAGLLRPFGFTVLAHDAYVDVESNGEGVTSASLDEVLATADVVTLHAPGRPEGQPLLGRDEIGRLKQGAVLVNTARGSLIDQDALLEGLRAGTPAVVGLDVFEPEPPGAAFAEVADRVILTPHMAWYTEESELDLRSRAAHEALRILNGRPPTNIAARPGGRQ